MIDEYGKQFIDTISSLREGRAINEAGRELAAVVEGVHETAGAGTLTLTLKIALQKDSSDVIETVDKVTSVTPEERRDTWFFGPGGILTRRRPRNKDQVALGFDLRDGAGNELTEPEPDA